MHGVVEGTRDATAALALDRGRPLSSIVPQLSRYAVVSAAALALDFALFVGLTALAVRPSLAGVLGYAAGMSLHYLLSVRFVFDARATDKPQARLFGEFVLTGIGGMSVTAFVIALATEIVGIAPLLAKILAAGASFLLVFALRRCVVFARRGTAGAHDAAS